ncbi:hypothetical protein, partial [Hydrogenophaga sp.]|uniref:hypothetical protein n=1 Tax=Hydrogenophaga sp. TaxID=1904254 RepID=UPI002C180FDF
MAPSSSTTRTQQNHSKQKGHGKPCRTRKTSRTTRFQDKVTQRIFTITTLIPMVPSATQSMHAEVIPTS